MSEVHIRPAKKEDMVAVADMIQELADFEKMPDGPQIKAKDLQEDGFETQPPAFSCLVAELQELSKSEVIGYALYFPIYSTWQGKSMMLEDLYVRTDKRRKGVGQKLFNSVAKEASASGSRRLDFHVLKWNDARSFYEKKGALNLTESEEWCHYRLSGNALLEAANQAS